jgi:hypothetical protein
MAKIHYLDSDIISGAPKHVKGEYRKNGEDGSLCGYVRKSTTVKEWEVTCYYCKRILEANNGQ